jgi:hypothetical protein
MTMMPTGSDPKAPDVVRFEVYLDPAEVPNTSVTLYVPQERGGTGFRLKFGDHLK